MRIAGVYSFNNGAKIIEEEYPEELSDIYDVIAATDAYAAKNKRSKEKTTPGKVFFSPGQLNKQFKLHFAARGWSSRKVECSYPTGYYVGGYRPKSSTSGAFREMDFLKGRVGVEVQFGKYAFMVYNVAAKMTIFHKLGFIDVGVEIVAVKEMANEMSTGVSYFEQFVWDLEERGVSDIDIPVLVLGIAPNEARPEEKAQEDLILF